MAQPELPTLKDTADKFPPYTSKLLLNLNGNPEITRYLEKPPLLGKTEVKTNKEKNINIEKIIYVG